MMLWDITPLQGFIIIIMPSLIIPVHGMLMYYAPSGLFRTCFLFHPASLDVDVLRPVGALLFCIL